MNKQISLAVCDDDEIVCEAICRRIYKFFKNCGIDVTCDKYVSSVLLYKNVEEAKRKYDVIFLDIDMPGLNGVDLAKYLRDKKISGDIVFVSNREDKVFDTFAARPFGFIRKNNFTHDLNDTLRSYIKMHVIDDAFVAFKTMNNSVAKSIRVSEIVYIESFRYKQFVYTSVGEPIEIHMTMNELEEKLKEYDIVRVYQGYLVNLKYVRRIDRSGVVLNYKENVTINISRNKVQELKTVYLNYLRKMGAVLFDEEE